jgi:uncharacterized lipoprotein YmbA
MRTTNFLPVAGAAILGSALLLAGCASNTGPQYYSLAETKAPGRAPMVPAAGAAPLYIEFAPIAMPDRFARPQMVVRKRAAPESPGVDILEDHRWSSSFEFELRDALGSGIVSRLGAVDVTKSGRQRGQPVTRIAVQMGQFDAVEGSRVDASFTWTVRRTDEGAPTGCQLSVSEPVGSGFDALAQGAQRVTAKLADAIASSISAINANQAPPCAA